MSKNNQTIDASLTALIKQYQGLVYSVVFGITLDSEESWDLTQEVMAKACRCEGFTAPEFNQKAWLVKVARNDALKSRRSLGRRLRYLARFCGFESVTEARALEDRLIRDEKVAKLKELLQKLDEEERQILTLRFNAEMSYQEIAAEMQLKPGTVMSRLARLKDRLGLDLQEEI